MALTLSHKVDEGANINNSIDVIVGGIDFVNRRVTFEIMKSSGSRYTILTPRAEEHIDEIYFSLRLANFTKWQVRVAYTAPKKYRIIRREYHRLS